MEIIYCVHVMPAVHKATFVRINKNILERLVKVEAKHRKQQKINP